MTSTSTIVAARSPTHRATERVTSASERRADFHTRVLDAVRKFLEDHAIVGKTGPREFYEFERDLHAKLMEVEREVIGPRGHAADSRGEPHRTGWPARGRRWRTSRKISCPRCPGISRRSARGIGLGTASGDS